MATTDYGVCVTCGTPMPTEASAQAHRQNTGPSHYPGMRAHAIRVLNPPPKALEAPTLFTAPWKSRAAADADAPTSTLWFPCDDSHNSHAKHTWTSKSSKMSYYCPGVYPAKVELDPDTLVAWAMEQATQQFCEDMAVTVEDGEATYAEISAAVSKYPDFSDAWEDYVAENDLS